jgi:Meiotically up-regulated gene 113
MHATIKGLYLRKNSNIYWFRHTIGGKQVRKSLGTSNYMEACRKVQEMQKPIEIVRSRDHGWVYLVKCGDFYKIGISKKLDKRLETLQTSNPHPIELIKSWKYDPWHLVIKIERLLHKHFKPYHHKLEWFQLPEVEVARLCSAKSLIRNHYAHGLPIEIFIP